MHAILEGLNPVRREAVSHIDGLGYTAIVPPKSP